MGKAGHGREEDKVFTNVVKVPEHYPNHPGGQSNLDVAKASKDPDLLFLSYHLGFDLDGKITCAAGKHMVTMPKTGPFYRDIHEAILKVRAEHGTREEYVTVFMSLLITAMALYGTYLNFLQPSWLSLMLQVVGFATYPFIVFHTRHHRGGNLFRKHPLLTKITYPLFDLLDNVYNINPKRWKINHQGSHHLYTNDYTRDCDVSRPHPVLRLTPDMPWHWTHQYQQYYAPFVLMLNAFTIPIDNLLENPNKVEGLLYLMCNWIITYVIPIYLHGLAGAGGFVVYTISGLTSSYMFQVSHNNAHLQPEKYAPPPDIDTWLKMQVEQAVSYGGYWQGLCWGAINFQIEHHLCPAHDPSLYYFIMKAIRPICDKHNVKYAFVEGGFWHAVSDYHKWLAKMGRKPVVKTE